MNRSLELIKKGYLIQDKNLSDLLSKISDEDFKKILDVLPKTTEPKVLKKEDILRLMGKTYNIKILTPKGKEKITIIDVVNIMKSRFDFFLPILKKKLSFFNLLSINKISKKYRVFSIIGIVYKIYDNKITLEDMTGKVEVVVEDKNLLKYIEEDCVIGAKCYWNNNVIIANEIIFPEYENNQEKEINLEKINVFFESSNFKLDEIFDISIVFCNEENKILNNVVYLNNRTPIHRILVNECLILFINENFIKFDFEKFYKLRLIKSSINQTIKFGTDLFLIQEKPNIIFLYNSNLNKIEERNKIVLINIKNNQSKICIDLKNREFC
ncbi:MAG: hypothetical protein QXP52_02395 [Candidatus Aenigmatarchaeota archaeon]